MKKILITGASRGLGRRLADFLSRKGYCVYATTRNLENAKETDQLKFLYLDLRNKDSINHLCDRLLTLTESLDGVIHNSGVAYLAPADVLDEEEYRHIFDVNFFGPVYLTKKILPTLRKARKSNIIFISSIVSVDIWPYLGVYSASKAAMESVAFEWAVLLKKWNINISIIRPNPLPTDMQILKPKASLNDVYPELKNRKLNLESIDNVCATIAEILNSPSPHFAYQTGPFSKKIAKLFRNEKAYEKSLRKYRERFS